MDRSEMAKILPMTGRDLLASSAVFYEDGSIEFRYYVESTLEVFENHLPGMPMYPGHLILEVMNQACAFNAYCCKQLLAGKKCVLASIGKVRFERVVLPGATLKIEIKAMREELPYIFFKAEAKALPLNAEDSEENYFLAAYGEIVGKAI